MKKLSALILTLFFVLAVNSNSFSQAKVIIHLTGGYSLPLPDLKGDFPTTLAGFNDTNIDADVNSTYLIKNGFNFGLIVKYALGKKGNVRVYAGANYNMFNQKEAFTESGGVGSIEINNKMSILSPFVGVEYAFQPRRRPGWILNPFVGGDITGSFFGGEVEWSGDTSFTIDRKSESRFGFAIGGGLDIGFSEKIGAVVGIKYNIANLLGKDYDSTATNEIPLNDKEHPSGSIQLTSKNISFVQFYGGLSISLGQPKKRVRK